MILYILMIIMYLISCVFGAPRLNPIGRIYNGEFEDEYPFIEDVIAWFKRQNYLMIIPRLY